MKLRIFREACCSQDDQIGPLCIDMEFSDEALVADVANEIDESGFLQFSSSYSEIYAYSGDKKLFSIPSPYIEIRLKHFFINKTDIARSLIQNEEIRFQWNGNL